MILSFLLVLIVSVSSRRLPPEINKCRLSDPKLSECLQTAIVDALYKLKDGNKDLGTLPFEPLVIPKLHFGNTSAGAVAIKQEYENMQLYDITNATILDLNVNLSDVNCYWKVKALTPKIRMEADYKMTGQILVLPINGHGKCHNLLYDSVGTYDIKCEKYTKKGKKYFRVTDLVFKLAPKRIIVDFENLVDGNEQLSREIGKTLNENSESVYADIGFAFDEAMGQLWKEIMNRVFSRVPEDELFLP